MTWRVDYAPGAARDLDEAFAYLAATGPDVVERFASRLSTLERFLAETPRMYPATRHGERSVALLPFRYVAFYRIVGDDVIVFGCFHASRDPRVVRDILRSRR